MPLIPNIALFQRKLGGFPIATYQAGETVIAAASTSGRLLILRTGAVAVLRDGVEIATVREPGAVFGELSVLLDQPHSADVRAWRSRSSTSPMPPPSCGWTRSRCFTSQQSWRGGWTTPIRR
jgi:hypothetical protein